MKLGSAITQGRSVYRVKRSGFASIRINGYLPSQVFEIKLFSSSDSREQLNLPTDIRTIRAATIVQILCITVIVP